MKERHPLWQLLAAITALGALVLLLNSNSLFNNRNKLPMDGDARVQVVEERNRAPYNAIFQLKIKGNIEATCTGFAVAPRVVATARHCLINTKEVIILRDRKEYARSTDFAINLTNLGEDYEDYGAVFLKKPLPVKEWFALNVFKPDAVSKPLITAGYPDDKAPNTMWKAEYLGFKQVGPLIASGGVAAKGQSGSPLFRQEKGRFVAVAILCRISKQKSEEGQTTFFLPFTPKVIDKFKQWLG